MYEKVIRTIVKSGIDFLKAQQNPIAAGAIVVGILTSCVLAAKAGAKSAEDIAVEETESGEELSGKDIVRLCWKRFIPVIVLAGLSIGGVIWTSHRYCKEVAALSVACGITERFASSYMEETLATVGPKKEKGIRDRAAVKEAEKNPPAKRGIIDTRKGDQLCFDTLTEHYFRSDMDSIIRSIRNLNGIMDTEGEVSVPMYCSELWNGGTRSNLDYLGWKIEDKDPEYGHIHVEFTSGIFEGGETYLIIQHLKMPKHILY